MSADENRGWGKFRDADDEARYYQEQADDPGFRNRIEWAHSYLEALPWIAKRNWYAGCAHLLRTGAWRFTDRPVSPLRPRKG